MKKSERYVPKGEIPENCPLCGGELKMDYVSDDDGVLYRLICDNPECSYTLDVEYELNKDSLR